MRAQDKDIDRYFAIHNAPRLIMEQRRAMLKSSSSDIDSDSDSDSALVRILVAVVAETTPAHPLLRLYGFRLSLATLHRRLRL